MDEWIIWLILALVFALAEIVTLTTALAVLAGAALVTAGVAAFGLPLIVELVVFALASAVGVVLVRPIALRHLHRPQLERFGIDALVGKRAYVIREVTGLDGLVRIGGEEWSARAYDETLVIPEGSVVDVMEITGSTALVYPRE